MSISYDELAPLYDELYGEEQRVKYEAALRYVSHKGKLVLDVGCGTGMLLEHLEGVEYYVGLDSSKGMVLMAKRRLRRINTPSDLVLARGELMPFRESIFTLVTSFTVIHEKPEMLEEMLRVAKGSSTIIISILRKCPDTLNIILDKLERLKVRYLLLELSKLKDKLLFINLKKSFE